MEEHKSMKLITENPNHLNLINLHHFQSFMFCCNRNINMNTSDSVKEPRKASTKPSFNQDSHIRKISQPPVIFSARLPVKTQKPFPRNQGKMISQHKEEDKYFVKECFSGMFWDYTGTEDKEEQDKDDKYNEDENKEMIKEETSWG